MDVYMAEVQSDVFGVTDSALFSTEESAYMWLDEHYSDTAPWQETRVYVMTVDENPVPTYGVL